MPRAQIVLSGSVVRLRTLFAAVGVASLGAFYAGWHYAQPDPAPQVLATPARPIPGGLRLATTPKAEPDLKSPIRRAKGERLLAAGSVTVRPATARARAPSPTPGAPEAPACSCEPIKLDFAATVDREGQPAVSVVSSNGQVVDGEFSPLFRFNEPPKRPAVLAVGTNGRGASLLYGRDVGPFWVGGQATYDRENGPGGFLHFGMRLR